MSSAFYILSPDREPVPCNYHAWEEWFADPKNRKVAQSQIHGFVVSTIFLGLNLFLVDAPRLYETKVFRHQEELVSRRYVTWDEAIAGHNRIVENLAHDHPEGHHHGQ